MALSGIRVLELAGLAPVPFCGVILADFGATVVRVDRAGGGAELSGSDLLARGKKSIALDLKRKDHVELIKKIIPKFDVLLEPYRPGVLERLGLGPDVLLKINPRLIYARLTGYGQRESPQKMLAGHDLNYLAHSGLLAAFQRAGEKPMFPANILGDFAGGSLVCAFGILAALIERSKSGKGQVVDSSIVDGTVYLGTFLYNISKTPIWSGKAGQNLLDSGAPNYEVYETKDGKHVAVGCLEPQFYAQMLQGIGLEAQNLPSYLDRDSWPELKRIFTEKFKEKTRDEWKEIFQHTDACVTPVLTFEELGPKHVSSSGPLPAPLLSRTPATASSSKPEAGEHTTSVLMELGIDEKEIRSIVGPNAKL